MTKFSGSDDGGGITPLGVHDLIRKVDLQIIVKPDDFHATINALHHGLVQHRKPSDAAILHAVA